MNRKNALKSITGLAVAALVPVAAEATAATAVTHPKPQNIVFHLNNSEGENALHSAFMGIGLATALRRMGADVTLMLDASGPNLAKSEWSGRSFSEWSGRSLAPVNMPLAPSMPPMKLGDLLAGFVEAGGSIRLCPHCSAMCGVTPGGTVPGARMAAEGELARIVYAADKIINY